MTRAEFIRRMDEAMASHGWDDVGFGLGHYFFTYFSWRCWKYFKYTFHNEEDLFIGEATNIRMTALLFFREQCLTDKLYREF